MEKQRAQTVKEMVSEGLKEPGIKVELINEPDMQLMTAAALNLYYEN